MLGFIVAIVAGFLTPHLVAPVAVPLVKVLEPHIKIDPVETRLIAFMIAMLLAGIAAALLTSGTAFWVVFGGILGYFGTRIVELIKKQIDARKDPE
ncbi:hypothetical protein [Yoonia sp. BS5-3]|uniref:Uncharacterized protein n=1 Tax=Yoonia phaeophyticola TaxID=3137369 RepID=A0ABZ2V543_9RHOB